MSISEQLIDKRVIRRNLERSVVERGAFDRYLEQLPDCAGKCVQASPEVEEDDAEEQDQAVAP